MSLLLTQSSTPIIGQIATLMGWVLNFIYNLGIHNIGVCIIILTFFVYMLMLPLTIKQQKFSKISALMQPELKKLQKKYQNKRDQASMAKMQEEQRQLYDKYGTSPTGGCLSILITFPLLFGFYYVVRNIPAYISSLKNLFLNSGVVDAIIKAPAKTQEKFVKLIAEKPIQMGNIKASDLTNNAAGKNQVIDALWKFNDKHFDKLGKDIVPKASSKIDVLSSNIHRYTDFLCYNIAESPMIMMQQAWSAKDFLRVFLALLIPILSGLTQWINIKLMPQPQQDPDSGMGNSLKMMNLLMPLFSIYLTFTLPIGLGIYWIAAAVFRSVQQVLINRHLNKIPVEDMIAQNKAKLEKKRARKGLPPSQSVREKANVYTKSVANDKEESKSSSPSKSPNAPKPGSLAEKAALVKNFNDKNKTSKSNK